MRINIENMLRQIGEQVGNRHAYQYVLGSLTKDLKELRDRSRSSPSEAVKVCEEFFATYVFSDNQQTSQGKGPDHG
jgi:hypothetical protein